MVYGPSSFLVVRRDRLDAPSGTLPMTDVAAPPRSAVAPWAPIVAAGVVAAMHIWKLPGVMDQVQADLGMSLVDVGVLMGIVQVASLLLGLAVSLVDVVGLRRTLVVGLAALADAAGGWGSSWVLTVGASLLGLALTPLALRAPRARGPRGMRSARRSRPRPPGRA